MHLTMALWSGILTFTLIEESFFVQDVNNTCICQPNLSVGFVLEHQVVFFGSSSKTLEEWATTFVILRHQPNQFDPGQLEEQLAYAKQSDLKTPGKHQPERFLGEAGGLKVEDEDLFYLVKLLLIDEVLEEWQRQGTPETVIHWAVDLVAVVVDLGARAKVNIDHLGDCLDNVVEDLRALFAKFQLLDGRLGQMVPIMG
jgi:hypothetical protein